MSWVAEAGVIEAAREASAGGCASNNKGTNSLGATASALVSLEKDTDDS